KRGSPACRSSVVSTPGNGDTPAHSPGVECRPADRSSGDTFAPDRWSVDNTASRGLSFLVCVQEQLADGLSREDVLARNGDSSCSGIRNRRSVAERHPVRTATKNQFFLRLAEPEFFLLW